jgi:soluble lytic murein transglycosylase-like protein
MIPWVFAVIDVESGGDPNAKGGVGEIGLMQLRPEFHAPGGDASRLYDPETNIRIGTAYLDKLWNTYWRIDYMLAAYNMGPTAFNNSLKSGKPYLAYANKVRDRAVSKYLADSSDFISVIDRPILVEPSTSPQPPKEKDIKMLLAILLMGLAGLVVVTTITD